MDAYSNRHYLDPVLLGKYPDELKEIFGEAWITPRDEDMKLIREPIDFLGVNYYSRSVIKHDDNATAVLRESGSPNRKPAHRNGMGGLCSGTYPHSHVDQIPLRRHSALHH